MIMSFERRYEAIKQVVEWVLTDLRQLCRPTSLHEYVLNLLVDIRNDTVSGEKISISPVERQHLYTKSEQELDRVYNIITSDFFYNEVTKRRKKLCMSNLKHCMFENQESYVY